MITAQCGCGKVQYKIHQQPLFRNYCHCSICQSVNHAAHADICVFRAREVETPDKTLIEYKAHAFPPILQRGKCIECGDIAVEFLKLGVLPEMAVIPSKILRADVPLPDPAFHMFYDNCVAEVDDSLPKGKGYLASQWLFAKQLISVLFKQ
ncbi:GFA family protein [Bacterioplanoides sp.]|uniref:GFA family protein n=1 Tax=Bacterioplanoides sp. TaxID=2066072 RepID=UPI003B0037AB